MKQLFFSLLFIALFQLTAHAQYEFGTYFIDANLNFNSSNVKTTNTTALSTKNNGLVITPEIGYFIQKNLAIGIGLSYKKSLDSQTYTSFTALNSDGSLNYTLSPATSNEFSEIAPVLFIKYFYQPTKKLSLSLKASYSKGWGTYNLIQKYTKDPQGIETVVLSEKHKIESKYLFLSPELQYLVTKKVGLQINFNGLGYTSTTRYDNDYFFFSSYNPSLSAGSITKRDFESTNFSINPSAWSFGVFVLLN
jgi:outer membrane immunogenic protein